MTNLRPYTGKRAEQYDAIRAAEPLWTAENAALDAMLSVTRPLQSLTDIPVGTGRFQPLYLKHRLHCIGVDLSPDMISVAQGKGWPEADLAVGDIMAIGGSADWAVCVRLLNWLEPENLARAIAALARHAILGVFVTIRHAERERRPDTGTITHATATWYAAMEAAGLVDSRRVLLDKSGTYLYLLRHATWGGQQPAEPAKGLHVISHSLAGKSTFCNANADGRLGYWLIDQDAVVKAANWTHRDDVLRQAAASQSIPVALVQNVHRDQRPLAPDLAHCVVLPPLAEVERNHAARVAEWADAPPRARRPESLDLAKVMRWRDQLATWAHDAKLPTYRTFAEALRSSGNLRKV